MGSEDMDRLEASLSRAVQSADTGLGLDAMRESLEAFDAGGADAVADLLHPDFELNMQALLPDGRVYHGIEGFRRWRQDVAGALEFDRFEPQAVRFVDKSRFMVFGRLRSKGRASGAETDVPLTQVYEMQDGKTRRMTMYSDASEALEAVGLRD